MTCDADLHRFFSESLTIPSCRRVRGSCCMVYLWEVIAQESKVLVLRNVRVDTFGGRPQETEMQWNYASPVSWFTITRKIERMLRLVIRTNLSVFPTNLETVHMDVMMMCFFSMQHQHGKQIMLLFRKETYTHSVYALMKSEEKNAFVFSKKSSLRENVTGGVLLCAVAAVWKQEESF